MNEWEGKNKEQSRQFNTYSKITINVPFLFGHTTTKQQYSLRRQTSQTFGPESTIHLHLKIVFCSNGTAKNFYISFMVFATKIERKKNNVPTISGFK